MSRPLRPPPRRLLPHGVAALLLVLLASPPAAGQGTWDAPRVRALVERAVEARNAPPTETPLRSYRARAEGHLYFYLQRDSATAPALVRADQIALELFWQAPGRTRQRIIGMRDESTLPNRMRYHLDHLTVVQDEFGDQIRLGHGDEVENVPHPISVGADSIYQYRLADSLTLRLPGAPEPVRVYEVQVRPRDASRPAYVGSVYLDRAGAAIVRMSFTFTRASYVDPRLDDIRISLDNGLWEGRHWLPHEQRVQIRRQIPELDLSVRSVISGLFRIHDYELNPALPRATFFGPRVTLAPSAERDEHPFREGLYDALDDLELAAEPLEDIAAEAARLVDGRRLGGLPSLRLHLPSVSSVLRANRAEEVHVGAGVAYVPGPRVRAELGLGYATGPARPSARLGLAFEGRAGWSYRLDGFLRRTLDLGLEPGLPGLFNSVSVLLDGPDYLDPYYATGIELRVTRGAARTLAARLTARRDASAEATAFTEPADPDERAVRGVHEGLLLEAAVSAARPASPAAAVGYDVSAAFGRTARHTYARLLASTTAEWHAADRRAEARASALAGWLAGEPPQQRLFLIGGIGTLPGHPYRGFAGTGVGLVRLSAAHDLVAPWLRLRALAGAGLAHDPRDHAPAEWGVRHGGVRGYVGAGVGVFYDTLRFEVARGLNGGSWEAYLTVAPDLRDLL